MIFVFIFLLVIDLVVIVTILGKKQTAYKRSIFLSLSQHFGSYSTVLF